ncbi:MAG: Trm112 family protein [Thermoanaerobaculia bacterium]
MPVDPELLDILVCPQSRAPLQLVPLPETVRLELIARYREHFHDEEPQVEEGLYCAESGLVYPIVSDIPIMLVDEALPASVLEGSRGSEGAEG